MLKEEARDPPLLIAYHPAAKLSGVLATLQYVPLSSSEGLPGGLDKVSSIEKGSGKMRSSDGLPQAEEYWSGKLHLS